MKRSLQRILPAALALLFAATLKANNIQVNNISLTDENTTDKFVMVQFDLTWDNSWRYSSSPANWDAAWVFVKYRVGSDDWQHALLNDAGHSSGTGTGANIDAGLQTPGTAFHATDNPGIGVFIYRDAEGTGTFTINGAQLRWNYGANSVADNATVDVRVFAIEMVYVPEGSFYVGSGGNESGRFYQADDTSSPFEITGEAAITKQSSGEGNLWGAGGISGNNAVAPSNPSTIPNDFPKGFAAFYCMKYQISQQQYVDFLNTLTYTQQNTRVEGSPDAAAGTFTNNANRHKIKINTSGVDPNTPAIYETDHPYVACNFLSWMDGAAYMDWAGLRPITELEFEKACRGTATPVSNEYAWGTDVVYDDGRYTLSNGGVDSEGIASGYSTTAGNANYTTTRPDSPDNGPMRVGVFATGSSTRVQSGASYYGIMELSGNLMEQTVTVSSTTGLAFTGVHGDGALSANGHANETAWPGLTGSPGEVTSATGSGYRGGDWNSQATDLRVSDRSVAAFSNDGRSNRRGFRGVRRVSLADGS